MAVYFLFLLVFVTIINFRSSAEEDDQISPVVSTTKGKLTGRIKTNGKGTRYFAFEGIHYGQPPVGKLRFQAPVASEAWNGVKKADTPGVPCVQVDFEDDSNYVGDEDCLSLNVYTPELPSNSDEVYKAVMVFIHGGGFWYGNGSSKIYNPGYFMDKDVVLVTLNYRLGVLGFLSTGDEVVPGNAGLLDQTEALRWVKDNIHAFGGNPLHVTIFGQSAGAASALYHLLSPLSKGLFHRVIAQSGSPLCRWAFQKKPLQWAQNLALDVGCPKTSSFNMVSCLQKVSAKELVTKISKKFKFLLWPMPFLPTVDNGRTHPFLNETPEDLLQTGRLNRVPVISGITKDEGFAIYAILKKMNLMNRLNSDEIIELLLSTALGFKDNINKLREVVKKEYFSNSLIENNENFDENLIEFSSDGMNKICNAQTVDLLSENGIPTYMYSLEYMSQTGQTATDKLSQEKGIGHGSDIPLLFENPDHSLSPQDEEISDKILNFWTNFAKFSVPILDFPRSWVPLNPGNRTHIKININPVQVDDDSNMNKKIKFWSKTLHKLESKVFIRSDEL